MQIFNLSVLGTEKLTTEPACTTVHNSYKNTVKQNFNHKTKQKRWQLVLHCNLSTFEAVVLGLFMRPALWIQNAPDFYQIPAQLSNARLSYSD